MLRVVDELLFAFRRDGFVVSTAQALLATEALLLVGFADANVLADALEAVIGPRASERARFRASFDSFFRLERGHPGDLFERLRFRGFAREELSALRDLLDAAAERSGEAGDALALSALRGHPGELDHVLALAGVRRTLASMTSPLQAGYFAEKLGQRLGVGRAASAIGRIRQVLIEALGERGIALADALEEELSALRRRVRVHVEQKATPQSTELPRGTANARFETLGEDEVADVRRAVRTLAERLRGAERVRRRRAKRGRIDVGKTMRRALVTGGVPFSPVRRRRNRDKPRLVVVCDISESVRAASRFMLEFVAQTQELFADTRSFVFVRDAAETTALFAEASPQTALATIASGSLLAINANSSYGRAFRTLDKLLGEVDKQTTLVILGDGRTPPNDLELSLVEKWRSRARGVLWLCPESRASWGTGDSAMLRYADVSSMVLSATTARELEDAARTIVHFR